MNNPHIGSTLDELLEDVVWGYSYTVSGAPKAFILEAMLDSAKDHGYDIESLESLRFRGHTVHAVFTKRDIVKNEY